MNLSVTEKLQIKYQKYDTHQAAASEKVVYYIAAAAVFALIASLVHFTQFFDGHSLFLMRAVSVVASGTFLIGALYQHVQYSEKMKKSALFTAFVAAGFILAVAALSSGLYFQFSPYITFGLAGGSAIGFTIAGSMIYDHKDYQKTRQEKLLAVLSDPSLVNMENYETLLVPRNAEGLNLLQQAVTLGNDKTAVAFLKLDHNLRNLPLPDGTHLLNHALKAHPQSALAKKLFLLTGYYGELNGEHHSLMGEDLSRFCQIVSQNNISDEDINELRKISKTVAIEDLDEIMGSDQTDQFLYNFLKKHDNPDLFDIFFNETNETFGTRSLNHALKTHPNSTLTKNLFLLAGYYDLLTTEHHSLMGGDLSRFFQIVAQDKISDEDIEELRKIFNTEAIGELDEVVGKNQTDQFLYRFVGKHDNPDLFDIFFNRENENLLWAIQAKCPKIAHFVLINLKSSPQLSISEYNELKKLYSKDEWPEILKIWQTIKDRPDLIQQSPSNGESLMAEALDYDLPKTAAKLLDMGFYKTNIKALYQKRELGEPWSALWDKCREKIDIPENANTLIHFLDHACTYGLVKMATEFVSNGYLTSEFLKEVEEHLEIWGPVLNNFKEKADKPFNATTALYICCEKNYVNAAKILVRLGFFYHAVVDKVLENFEMWSPVLQEMRLTNDVDQSIYLNRVINSGKSNDLRVAQVFIEKGGYNFTLLKKAENDPNWRPLLKQCKHPELIKELTNHSILYPNVRNYFQVSS